MLTSNNDISEDFGSKVPMERLIGNLRRLHNMPQTVNAILQGNYKENIEYILSEITRYEKGRVHLALTKSKQQTGYDTARKYFYSIEKGHENYWDAQFQLGQVEQKDSPQNHFRKSRLYWTGIPEGCPAYGDAQYALGNLGDMFHSRYREIPIGHKRYEDGLFKLGCIAAIGGDKKEAGRIFHSLPDTYQIRKVFQKLFPLEHQDKK